MGSKQDSVLSLFSGRGYSPASFPAGLDSSASLVGYAFVPSSTTTRGVDIFPSGIGALAKGHQFSIFKKSHAEEAAAVVDYLVSCDNFEKFREDAARLREILNEGIYLYAVSTAVLHRKDTSGALLPPLWQVNPRHYFPGPVIKRAFDLARSGKGNASDGSTAPAFTTGSNRDPEFKLAWWREDCSFNAHHYHWHQAYPWRGIKGLTKDRQGELFYYMHQQMLARYDAERLAVGLMRVEPYSNWHLPIPEGYNPQLTDYYGTYQFAARPTGLILADLWRDPSDPTLIIQQEYHRNRLLDAINTGKFEKPDGTKVDVDIVGLGAAIEATVSSPNPDLYGDVGMHNRGHDILAGITDPDYRYNQAMGVMGNSSAAIRDPIFFRWHKFLDDLFFLHKIKLAPYTQPQLEFKDIKLEAAQVQVMKPIRPANTLITRMQDVVVDIANDMFLHQNDKPNIPVNVTVKQVNHDTFKYDLRVTNNLGAPVKAAIRIFIAPSINERGTQFQLDSQRRLFIEMDKFVTTLTSGTNDITRISTRSSVIKPRAPTFAELKKRAAAPEAAAAAADDEVGACRPDRYCECGWPKHMLVPRGTAAGAPYDLFVIVTDWSTVDGSTDNLDGGTSYCGVRDKNYPDKRAMGFPFDRKIGSAAYQKVSDFASAFSNMMTVPIKITCL